MKEIKQHEPCAWEKALVSLAPYLGSESWGEPEKYAKHIADRYEDMRQLLFRKVEKTHTLEGEIQELRLQLLECGRALSKEQEKKVANPDNS